MQLPVWLPLCPFFIVICLIWIHPSSLYNVSFNFAFSLSLFFPPIFFLLSSLWFCFSSFFHYSSASPSKWLISLSRCFTHCCCSEQQQNRTLWQSSFVLLGFGLDFFCQKGAKDSSLVFQSKLMYSDFVINSSN